MVRFSDLLGSKGDRPEPIEPERRKPSPPAEVSSRPPAPPVPPATPPAGSSDSDPSGPAAPAPRAAGSAPPGLTPQQEVLYDKFVACVKALFEAARKGQKFALAEAVSLSAQLNGAHVPTCDQLSMLNSRYTDDSYLFAHSVNTAVMAHRLGRQLGLKDAPLQQLTLAALLHDLGMAGETENLANLPRELAPDEIREVSRHPANALKLLEGAQELTAEALAGILTHHERIDGSGYPEGSKADVLQDFGKIIAICDVYDAMTHSRAYRKRFSPAAAVKALVQGADKQFDRRVVRLLVDELSLYPRGSLIRLNTNEVAVVEQVHREAPLRPLVLVCLDAQNKPLHPPRALNLLEHPFIYVKDLVVEQD